MSEAFALHPQLAKDCITIGDLTLCRLLLMNNRQFPWLILVPRRTQIHELFDLDASDYTQTMSEIHKVSKNFARITHADKMNIAALGNQVSQLHIHIIARFTHDAAWPNPVWNAGIKSTPYDKIAQAKWLGKLQLLLKQ